MNILNENSKEINHPELDSLPSGLQDVLMYAKENEEALHNTESKILQEILKIAHQALKIYLGSFGNGDVGEIVTLDNDETKRRLSDEHVRKYVSIFGNFTISRVVYGTREGQRIEYIPLDALLQLPKSNFSYLLQNWDQELVQEVPYNQASEAIRNIFNINQSVNSMERMAFQMSASVDEYMDNLTAPPKEEEGELFVVQLDHKGVAMRKSEQPDVDPSDDDPARKGEKRMALVGAAYSVDPYIRTPEQMCNILMSKKPPKNNGSIWIPGAWFTVVITIISILNPTPDWKMEIVTAKYCYNS